MTEAELFAKVTALAGRLGLLWAHNPDSRRPGSGCPGAPDLLITGLNGVLHVELKDARGTPSPEQTSWHYMLRAAGASWRLWRPADWHSGLIETELRRIA